MSRPLVFISNSTLLPPHPLKVSLDPRSLIRPRHLKEDETRPADPSLDLCSIVRSWKVQGSNLANDGHEPGTGVYLLSTIPQLYHTFGSATPSIYLHDLITICCQLVVLADNGVSQVREAARRR